MVPNSMPKQDDQDRQPDDSGQRPQSMPDEDLAHHRPRRNRCRQTARQDQTGDPAVSDSLFFPESESSRIPGPQMPDVIHWQVGAGQSYPLANRGADLGIWVPDSWHLGAGDSTRLGLSTGIWVPKQIVDTNIPDRLAQHPNAK